MEENKSSISQLEGQEHHRASMEAEKQNLEEYDGVSV